MRQPTWRAILAEFLGAAALGVAVVGSGIAAQTLTEDTGLALLINSLATAGALFVIIVVMRPLSGAHINPVVSIADALTRGASWSTVAAYVPAQVAGFISGTVLSHAMFGLPLIQVSQDDRLTTGTFLAEIVATAGLVVIVFIAAHRSDALIGSLVAAYIGAAYFFTSSTSVANPGITVGRTLTDTFSGIAPTSGAAFIVAQLIGGALGLALVRILRPARQHSGRQADRT